MKLKEAAAEFLSHRRLAVAGVSRSGDTAATIIWRRLRKEGYEVFPVNPNADEVEGERCYRSIDDLPDGVEGVVVATHPAAAAEVVAACADRGIPRVWLHRSFGAGSVADDAVAVARERGLALLDGGCPMMFLEPVDVAHRCFRWILGATGKLPVGEAYAPPVVR